ncbi:nucleotidyltransferase domain-containing protein [Alkalicella caledoniensis]|uniref:Nucleotidyltransferase domain-containing protein n=1 Tax=Alkalicella caledoniensis TaxID=2731377 RepID=A0A7G9W7R3_ALKCA|nr:nucleotidyltransferase domain-containing protein [Alkalicella caledoniensis]QNO14725.1 nucleotidyltransferase domain-containing protein [Alkalicella caledoniensis]
MEKYLTSKRTILFKSLVGSHNYNLNDATSDVDFKVVIAPNFEDLYSGSMFSKQRVGNIFDIEVHDVRKLSSVWTKANINFIEILFSKDIVVNPTLNKNIRGLIDDLFAIKQDIAKMNLKYLYNSCIGMHTQKMKLLTKGTSGTMDLVEKFGYDTKQAQHAYRVLDFLERFYITDFLDFQGAIWYEKSDPTYKLLKDLKAGAYGINQFLEIAEAKLFTVQGKLSSVNLPELDIKTHNNLLEIIKSIVKLNM